MQNKINLKLKLKNRLQFDKQSGTKMTKIQQGEPEILTFKVLSRNGPKKNKVLV